MKRLPNCLFAFFMLIALTGNAAEIFVAVNGSDMNAGTKDQPLATLTAALRKARELRRLNDPSMGNGIHIIIRGGTYQLYEPVFIRPEDAGTSKCPTYIEAAVGEQPVLSGGVTINGWKKFKRNIWVANMPYVDGKLFMFRQLWVNDQKAVRAKDMNGDTMNRIISWDKKTGTCIIPAPRDASIKNVAGMEMFIHQWWAIAILRIKKMEISGDSARLFFYQPESRIQNEHPWPAPWISKETGNSAFYLSNAIQFLDEPGEWYLDVANRKLYYWPRKNENLSTANVTASNIETLIKIQGTADHPVTNIFFNGISFQHTGWLRPSLYGHVPHQDGMYMLDAYKLKPAGTPAKASLENQAWVGRPTAAVEISFADETGFENCRFEHLASTALDYNKGVHDNLIKGNLFKDIGGTAILAGVYSDEASEIHLPYNPSDKREICDGITISNNLITDAANEDWSCIGIGLGYTKNALVEHNEVENVSYTAISIGWGWSPAPNAAESNRIIANKIHHFGKHNYDCGGIYTLGTQQNTVISENYIDSIYKAPYAHLPSHWFYMYADEGSSYLDFKNNWMPGEKFLANNIGRALSYLNNGLKAGETVKDLAGLQSAYQYLSKEKTSSTVHLPINEEHPEIIELITKENEPLDLGKLKQLLPRYIDTTDVYRWQNHYVIFSPIEDVFSLEQKLRNNLSGVEVKWYSDLFYNFSKQKHCPDKTVTNEWENIILTADLVSDKKLQQEYLSYHATQFEKWPEVSAGFCNADFQRLMVFRNNRQLMLVISIPKGETLDHLNPKTTENNPRMDEWNKIMAKYQEGIPGTKKGETWVFLKQLK